MRVNVGSQNPTKVDAVRSVFEELFPHQDIEVRGLSVDSAVSEQPFNEEVLTGAIARANGAIGDGDFGVGIEAGLIFNATLNTHFDVQFCAIVDNIGDISVGHGPGFLYPPQIYKKVISGETVGEAMSRLTGLDEIGSSIGAIGYLSKKTLNRTELTRSAVLMALIPRIRENLYEE